jgi:hypothetical protein
VHAENLVVNEGRNRHAVKHILELLPNPDAEAALALVIKAINAVDLPALVISTQQEKVLFVLQLVGKQQNNRLEALFAAVNVITKEEIVCIGRESSIFEQSEKINELSMHIA